jgi:hypothetical protein
MGLISSPQLGHRRCSSGTLCSTIVVGKDASASAFSFRFFGFV